MESRAVFAEVTNEVKISKNTTPEFLLLYQQSILLALMEQGVIDELHLQLCMDALSEQFET